MILWTIAMPKLWSALENGSMVAVNWSLRGLRCLGGPVDRETSLRGERSVSEGDSYTLIELRCTLYISSHHLL